MTSHKGKGVTALLFIIVLGALVLVHEGGHFIAAKRAGVRVDEFGIGLPPRLFARRRGETEYSFNMLPFGGFVRIAGEDGGAAPRDERRSFSSQRLSVKLRILLAGVAANWILAVLLLGVLTTFGLPVSVSDDEAIPGASVVIDGVSSNSPAASVGLSIGDTIVGMRSGSDTAEDVTRLEVVQDFLRSHKGQEVSLTVRRNEETRTVTVIPRVEPPQGEGPLGISLVRIAFVSYPWYEAPWRGLFLASSMSISLVEGFVEMLHNLVSEGRVPEGLAGPVGIAALAGEVRTLGIVFVVNFIALLSLNLALINALPFPALDGGRAAIVLVEEATRRRIPGKALGFVHAVGFALLIAGIFALTIRDIKNLL